MLNIPEEFTQKVNSIMLNVPQSPFIVDVIGKAIELAYEHTPATFDEKLDTAIDVVSYVNQNSNPNFYKYNIIVAVLLMGVSTDAYTTLDTASGTVKEATEKLTAFVENKGWKDAWVKLNDIYKYDTDLFYVAMAKVVRNANELIAKETPTASDKYMLAGLGYLEVSLRKSAIEIPNNVYPVYNKFIALMVNKADF